LSLRLTCLSHHLTVKARDKKAVIRVSYLVIREKPLVAACGCSTSKRLTAGEHSFSSHRGPDTTSHQTRLFYLHAKQAGIEKKTEGLQH